VTPEQLSSTITAALSALTDEGALSLGDGGRVGAVRVERPKIRDHGDYSTNVAMQLAKPAGRPPREIAELLAARLGTAAGIESATVAGPGFLNIRVEAGAQGRLAGDILAAGAAYGRGDSLAGRRIDVEFISANPTGPLTLASTRWAAVGDALARLLTAQGAVVTREYYFNDHGVQIERFARSLLARARGREVPENGYAGAYLDEIVTAVLERELSALDKPDPEAQEIFRREGVELMFVEIKASLVEFGVAFDVYFHENSLHERGEVDAAVARLRRSGLVYEADGAVWLRSSDYGDDKDRVIIRSDGRPTYICADAAYYLDKRSRGHDLVLIVLGADHHGYVGRYRALAAAFGDDPDATLDLVIGQMVNLVREGRPVRMSKRAGTVITIDDLVDTIGVDAARYALARYSIDSAIDIDLEVWSRRSSDNPVFYVQYAHARLSAIIRGAIDLGAAVPDGPGTYDPALLVHPREGDLLRALAELPRVQEQAATLREPHRVARYLEATAATFHKFYDECRVLPMGDEPVNELHQARLALVAATRTVLSAGLDLLGVSAPERM